jgi:hypothetical protein
LAQVHPTHGPKAIADELDEPWSRGHDHAFLAALDLR